MGNNHGGASWTTQDELAFLAGLGTYNVGSEKTPRRVWLEQYMEAFLLRKNWQSIDSNIVAQTIRFHLEHCDAYPVESEAA